MSEPMLDKFLLSLQKENFTLKDVLTRDIASQEEYMQVYQAVLYLDKEHINTVLEGFKKLSADKQKLVVKNLIQLYPMSPQRIAGAFAAKEAVAKALGTGIGITEWREIEITHDEKGRPLAALSGKALKLMNGMGGRMLHVSISHIKDIAVAQAILEG